MMDESRTEKRHTTYPGKELEALSVARNYHRWIVGEIASYLGRRVAEVGAGVGSVSELILERDVDELFAFEPSGNMYPVLAGKLGRETRVTLINDFFSPRYSAGNFDSVVYINVLEHIEDDRAELTQAFESLSPGGHLAVFVPACSWLYSDFDRQIGHFRRYTKPGLCERVTTAGFTVVKARHFDIAGIIPWYVNFVLFGADSIGGRSVALYDRLIVPVMRVVEGVIPPPAGKNVLLIARKS